jgi:hypothetical protein
MSYNGHKNYNCWNVSLWINNDEGLYRLMKDCLGYTWNGKYNKNCSVHMFIRALRSKKITHTPDGVRYTFTNVRSAVIGDF